jgi:glycine betaine/choline ABC-type transport system substrate-binding protein
MGRTPILLLIAFVAAGCGSKPHIVVGAKNFTEQMVLGELIAQQLERQGIEVERKFGLGGTLLAHEALKSGSIDLYPEYTGTALTAVLKQPAAGDAAMVLGKVRDGYKKWGIEWLPPLGFNDSFAMVVRSEDARSRRLATLSDAARGSAGWRMGVGYEFIQRPDGLNGLVKAYNLRLEGQPVTMDLGLLSRALQFQKIDMAAANATDGMLAHPEFTVLKDDLHYFPPYECAIAIRSETLAHFPHLRDVLTQLSNQIPDASMRRMNESVDVQHIPVAQVVREFLSGLK